MDALVVDLTHGGVKIAVELEKLGQYENIYAYDIYNTLKGDEKHKLHANNIKLLDNENDIKDYMSNFISNPKSANNDLLVVNPIHSSFNVFNINSIREITHHKAVNLILSKWKKKINHENIPIIEVTGVKGKTSVVTMLKEILIHKNPLVLTSLGANLYKNDKKVVLKKNISITPASILETVKLAKKIANPDCIKIEENNNYNNYNNLCYGVCIFESSLGVTGLGNVGVLTNIVENYSIAKNSSNARDAKQQVFDCDIVAIEKETLEKYYSEKIDNDVKINTFSFTDKNANLFVEEIKFDLNRTNIKIIYNNIKTNSGKIINGHLGIATFAPGKHHVLNVLATVTTALSCDIDDDIIISGLANFKGIKGRTSLKIQENSIIIEEINPGINTKAIESSINMINNLNDYVVILGGKYGVTCEEIDENKVANLLDNILDDESKDNDFHLNKEFKLNLILTDELGVEIKKRMKNPVKFVKDSFEAQKIAINNKKNILLIYRSNYSQINNR